MPRGKPFQKGYDPRRRDINEVRRDINEVRHALTPEERGTAHVTNGLLVKNLSHIPAEFQVRVPSTATLPQLLDGINLLRMKTADHHTRLADTLNPLNLQAAGKYEQLIAHLADLYMQMEGGGLSPGKYKDLDPDIAAQMKRDFARAVSEGLTKLAHASKYADEMGIFDVRGIVFPWASDGMAAVIAGCSKIMEKWARLIAWEQKGQQRSENAYLEARAQGQVVQRRRPR